MEQSKTRDRNPVCHIVGAGLFEGKELLQNEGDYIIAADGGYLHLEKTRGHAGSAARRFRFSCEAPRAGKYHQTAEGKG